MADPRHDRHDSGEVQPAERWVHRHGASGERVAKYSGDPDPELSFTGIVWTVAGIAAITAVAMVLMVWMLGGLTDFSTAREAAPTPAELERREAVRRAGEERLAAESVPGPGLAVPPELELPPEPRLELHPTWNLEQLQKVEKDLLEKWATVDEETGAVRIPIETAIELAAAGELPGVPRGTAAGSAAATESGGEAAASEAGRVLQEAGESELGTSAEVHEPEEEPGSGPAPEEHDGEH